MCGRFALFSEPKKIERDLKISLEKNEPLFSPNYNCAPGKKILTLIKNKMYKTKFKKWGFPFALKKSMINIINIRIETFLRKKNFYHAYKKNRCIVIADGFYEWKKQGSFKIPYYIYNKTKEVFAFAALWGKFKTEDGQLENRCAILTTEACEQIKPIHNRMPLIVSPEKLSIWFDKFEYDKKLISDFNCNSLIFHTVSFKVNNPKNNYVDLIKPVVSTDNYRLF